MPRAMILELGADVRKRVGRKRWRAFTSRAASVVLYQNGTFSEARPARSIKQNTRCAMWPGNDVPFDGINHCYRACLLNRFTLHQLSYLFCVLLFLLIWKYLFLWQFGQPGAGDT
ncbi:hypothetical protein RSAG8_09656, partial [Rhizoctonia solani AG-8 WAC10335]